MSGLIMFFSSNILYKKINVLRLDTISLLSCFILYWSWGDYHYPSSPKGRRHGVEPSPSGQSGPLPLIVQPILKEKLGVITQDSYNKGRQAFLACPHLLI